ncbi:S-(hydroxymethyl)glutathione dehydrogenase/alcohol dehydrogenase [Caldalkalibacillus uzonensis]|uniref:S-(Hydroxymethyl)glutathione dehydrogenase/alcohol dehydrogenase n=1 Tax=Caldalkalibacillus uzonensis TaxID=353224 RepID=A0ABU0CWS8_9BACI|nr:Zn-dependent alcohol dehydrogenase [Caldalkalibacillus uzonensis]MDQ0340563.1 S-(hydroxymethyl)glutathione dehydrogenase/alcohol dehydrogenase [Caldalkalibacillus uzonensis]
MKIKAAVMTGVGRPLEIQAVDLAPPKANEVLVKVEATGVCHSDLNALNDSTTPTPTILGHEGAGIVVEVGPNVTNVQVGDKVALNWVPYCGRCEFCVTGAVHLCESAFGPMFNGTLLDGTSRLSKDDNIIFHYSLLSTFAEYTVVPEMSCVKLPDEMPMAQASLIGCGVATGYGAAVNAAKVTPGSTVAVFGIGGVGVNAIQGARIAGAAKIIACDVKPANLEIAKKFGATHTVNVAKDNVEEALKELTGGFGVHFAIDCSGHTEATENAWKGTRKGGTVVVVGAFNPHKVLSLPAGGFHRVGKILRGSFYGDVQPFRDFPTIARLYLDGRFMLDELILNRLKLEEINQAFDAFHDCNCINVGRSIIEMPVKTDTQTMDDCEGFEFVS